MEKFASFTKITDQYLNGKLNELVVNYEDQTHMHVHVSYEYNNYYWLDYEVEVDVDNKQVNFISHRSKSSINKVELSREKEFETAVSDYFFQN